MVKSCGKPGQVGEGRRLYSMGHEISIWLCLARVQSLGRRRSRVCSSPHSPQSVLFIYIINLLLYKESSNKESFMVLSPASPRGLLSPGG